MVKARSLVGLDVHSGKVVAAVLDCETGELVFRRLGGESGPVVNLCLGLPGPVRVTYEAGPTGYGLARSLAEVGIDCLVAAPGKIPRGATDRVKTDRRDAENLVRLLWAGKLARVRVPGPQEEAMRDLVRAREDLRMDLMRARHRLSKFLLRNEIRFEGRNWTTRHTEWLSKLEFGDLARAVTFADYRGGIEVLLHRRDGLERQIEGLIPTSAWAVEVGRLRCLRGVDTLTAIGLCVEIGDFRRFRKPGQLMSYLGLVPSEHTTGQARRQGSITKSGSRHARRLLVEAAWSYRCEPRVGREIERRQKGQPAEAVQVAWNAQRRLHRTYTSMRKRKKKGTVTAVAVARELAGFCWAITQIE